MRLWIICFFVLLINSHSFSQLVLKLDLDGTQVVPPVSTPAQGSGWLFLYEDLNAIRFNFVFTGLQGEFTEAYFNVGKPGEPGYIVEPIIIDQDGANGQWDNFPDSLLGHLLAEDIYISIHSSTYPGGELRGQVKKTRGYGFPLSLYGEVMIPPVSSGARGAGYVVINNNASSIDYKFTAAGLSSDVLKLSFHVGELGETGPEIDSYNVQGSTITGSWTGFGDSVITHMIRNRFYFKLSTAEYPDGELRANLFRHGEVMFRISLEGTQIVPALDVSAIGTGWGVISSNFSKLFYDITYANLSSPVTSINFGSADVGSNGDSLYSLSFDGNKASGTWDFFTDNRLQLIFKHKLYVIINTLNYPNGEIRGQLEFVRGLGFTTSLNGMGHIPATPSSAQGTGWFIYNSFDTDTDTAFYQYTIAGLSSPFAAAYFHSGGYNENGPAVEPIPFVDSTINSAWHITDPNLLAALMRGKIYVDVHSSDYFNGEIRGQVYFSNVQSGNSVDVKDNSTSVPSNYSISPNYPNPFNPSTKIKYTIPSEEFVKLKVYNLLGEEIAVLVNQVVKPGSYITEWNASGFASGIYFYRIEAGNFSSTHKMLLLK